MLHQSESELEEILKEIEKHGNSEGTEEWYLGLLS
jgi:hypothetical protein